MKIQRDFFALVLTVVVAAPAFAAAKTVVLEKQDFTKALAVVEPDHPEGLAQAANRESVLATLSESGAEKLNASAGSGGGEATTDVEIRVAGEDPHLKLRDPIQNSQIQFGPFDFATAERIVRAINSQH